MSLNGILISLTQDRLGEKVDIELCPGGKDKILTDENKQECLDLELLITPAT